MSTSVVVKRLGGLGDLEAVGPVWNELQDACSHQHVLMDHRWVSAWWRHFGRGKTQHTLVLSSGNTPVGIVPLSITRGREAYPLRDPYVMGPDDYRFLPHLRWWRLTPLRRLTFPLNIASGNIRGQAIVPVRGQEVFGALARYIADISGSWDVATLPGMRSSEQEPTALSAAARAAGLLTGLRQSTRRMLYLDLPSSFQTFLQARSGNFRKGLRKECSKLERNFASLGPMKVRCLRGAEVATGLQRMFALERKSWKVNSGKDRRLHLVLNDQTRSFFLDVAERFAANDEAQVLILSFGDTDAAGLFTLERKGVASCVLTYRDEYLGETVGIAPIWQELLSSSIDRGLQRIDINGYTRNYLKWTQDHHDYATVTLFNQQPYSRFLQAVDNGAMTLARLLPRKDKAAPEPASSSL